MADFAEVQYVEDAGWANPYSSTGQGGVHPNDPKPSADYIFEAGATIIAGPATPVDTTPPVVTLVSPLDRRVDPGEALVFDVTDNIGAFARIVFAVAFPSLGVTELVHDGAVFVDAFTAGSTRVAISNGWRYSLTRSGGWPASPRARVFVTDSSGNNES